MAFLTGFLQMRADEGMWLLMLIKRLNGVDMQKEGLHLTPEEIYSVNHSSMKDAIVSFGGYCTGEVVSPEGLLFTNHHCGYESIAALSTPEKDYLTDGFWAMKKDQELNAKNLYVRFLERMGDATERITSKLNNDMSASQREEIIKKEIEAIQKENSENGKYTVVVKDFFNGNEFYYFVYKDYKDIRLVGTPPNSLGKFGGDTDNWEWPRHTADFSVFRIYGDKSGNPSDFNQNNVPLSPKHFLPISLKGVKPDDFTMILGYPGRTNRYLTSYGIDQLISKDYPAWVEASKTAMDIIKGYMDKDDETRLGYASQYASLANYWKNRAGTIISIKENGTISEKQNLENKFLQWAVQPENDAVYGNVLKEIKNYYGQISNHNVEKNYSAILQRNVKYISIAYGLGHLFKTYADQTKEEQPKFKAKLENVINEYYEHFNTNLEGDLFNGLVTLYQNRVDKDSQAPTLASANAKELPTLAFSSIFANKKSALEFLNHPDRLKIDADKLFLFSNSYIQDLQNNATQFSKIDETFQKNTRLFLDGLKKSQPEKKFYPDANSTIRLTYGKVSTLPFRSDKNYYGVKENYYTDMTGLVAKYKKGDDEFDLPQRVLDLYKKKDFGIYADKKGYMPINFLSDNDITGGNSGSPIINGDGELLGLAFDGNSEALSGDIVFEKGLQKTINVDVRFVLWVIDKYAGAKNLIKEMKLVK